MVVYGPDETEIADKGSCGSIRAELKLCLLQSDCCLKDKKTPRQCLKERAVPEECLSLHYSFFECKRSLLDNRRRFRGLKVT